MKQMPAGWRTDQNRHYSRGTSPSIGTLIKWFFNALGPTLFFISLNFSIIEGFDLKAQQIIALAIWMLTWWITEFLPLPVTSLLPIITLPSFGIESIKVVTAPYASSIIYLFLGGFLIALGLEKWKLHRRIALFILKMMGAQADKIVLGFMIASAFLSMWISNTATAVMMLPIILSVVNMISEKLGKTGEEIKNLKLSMLLGTAYGANVGGMGTLIGTPPNAILAGVLSEKGIEISFLGWMLFAVPVVIIIIAIMYFLLTKLIYPNRMGRIEGFDKILDNELAELGPMNRDQKWVLGLFLTAATLWITKGAINALLGTTLNDKAIAMLIGMLFFVIPTSNKEGTRLLEWNDTKNLPWGVLLLFGGGLSLAKLLGGTGILEKFASQISSIEGMSMFTLMFILLGLIVVLTEVMSNTALATIFSPILASIAITAGYPVLAFCAPAVLAMSCVFSLPMGTPPNAVIFASGELKIKHMLKVGLLLDPISVIVLGLLGFQIAQLFLT